MRVPPFRTPVRSYELDALGHVNHAVYLNWFEQARYDALEATGLPPAELLRRGWGIHVVRIEVDYRAECRLGDAVEIRTEVVEIRNSSMTLAQRLVRRRARRDEGDAPGAPETREPEAHQGRPQEEDAVLAAEARVVAVWIGPDRRPMRIPQEIRGRFEAWRTATSDLPTEPAQGR